MRACLDEQRRRWQLHRHDKRYVLLGALQQQQQLHVFGVTAAGHLHVLRCAGERPVLAVRCGAGSWHYDAAQAALCVEREVWRLCDDRDLRHRTLLLTAQLNCCKERKEEKQEGEQQEEQGGGDAVPSHRVDDVFLSALCSGSGGAVQTHVEGRLLLSAVTAADDSTVLCVTPLLLGHLAGFSAFVSLSGRLLHTRFARLSAACGHAALVHATGALVHGQHARLVDAGPWLQVTDLGARSWAALRREGPNTSLILLDGARQLLVPFEALWIAPHSNVGRLCVGDRWNHVRVLNVEKYLGKKAGPPGHVEELQEVDDCAAIPRAPCSWPPFAGLDPVSFSLLRLDKNEVWWGDNSGPDWWPLYCTSDECFALLLQSPLRVVRHPLHSCSLRTASAALLARHLQLLLFRAAQAGVEPLTQLLKQLRAGEDPVAGENSHANGKHNQPRVSAALLLFCVVRLARRLDPEPFLGVLLPELQASFRTALSLSPGLAGLMLPLVGDAPDEAAALVAAQLACGMTNEALDTMRVVQLQPSHPVVVHHMRHLLLHSRLVSLLRLAIALQCIPLLPEPRVTHSDQQNGHAAQNGNSSPEPVICGDNPWDLITALQSQLGVVSPVLVHGDQLHLSLLQETRAQLVPLVTVAPPLWALASSVMLLAARPALAALLRLTEQQRSVFLQQPPLPWVPFASMLSKAVQATLNANANADANAN